MVAFQTALVERIRAIAQFRAAEQRGGGLEEPRAAVAQWTSVVRALIAEHAFPFVAVCDSLGLGQRQQDALTVIAAPHLDDTIRDAIAALKGRRHVDAALVISLVALNPAEAIEARSTYIEGGVLHRAGLVESVAVTTGHLASALEEELVPTPRLLRILNGQVGLDPRFAHLAYVVPTDPWANSGVVRVEQIEAMARQVTAAERAIRTLRGASILLAGPHGVGKLRCALAIAARVGVPRLLVVDAVMLPSELSRLQRVLEGLAYEAEIMGCRLLLRNIEHHVDTARGAAAVLAILQRLPQLVWATSDLDPRVEQRSHLGEIAGAILSLSYPDQELRADAWASELSARAIALDEAAIARLASDYPLARAAIADVAATFSQLVEAQPTMLATLAETKLPGQLGRYARRGKSGISLKDLVLPEHVHEELLEIHDAVKYRHVVFDRWQIAEKHSTGRGVVAMFNGPPGTGKTMAANAIANELGLPIYRIDTSSIVDRFVGETEKNLSRLFDEASASRSALLFDEADSLFGKRVEASDATDRHANMQINVLLNLIEDYDGLVVLTTNMKGALDSAFLRRIMFKLNFALPELEERTALWRYHLPDRIPQAGDVDPKRLAQEFEKSSGGDIKNAVLRAILSTRGVREITLETLRKSMLSEMRANGSVVVDSMGRSGNRRAYSP